MKKKKQFGDLSVIVGPMFSGKSSALREYIVRYTLAGIKAQVFKPIIDNRGEGSDMIKTHGDSKISAMSVKRPGEIIKNLQFGVKVVGIDEAQFFGDELVKIVLKIKDELGIKVVVAGLPADFRGEPFGAMPQLLALADDIIHCKAVCTFRDDRKSVICGGVATRTQRLIDGKPAKYGSAVIVVGGQELYEARCVKHHIVPGKRL